MRWLPYQTDFPNCTHPPSLQSLEMGRQQSSVSTSNTSNTQPMPEMSPEASPTRASFAFKKIKKVKKSSSKVTQKTSKCYKFEVIKFKKGRKTYNIPCFQDKDFLPPMFRNLIIAKTLDDDVESDNETVENGLKLSIRDLKKVLAEGEDN